MAIWYYQRGSEQRGPVSWETIVTLCTEGNIRGDTFVWTEGMSDWLPARQVEALRGVLVPSRATMPPSPAVSHNTPHHPVGIGEEYASFGARFGALLIDFVCVFVLGFIGGIVGAVLGFDVEKTANVIGVVIYWLYAAILESSPKQSTFGKRALGLRVTTVDGDRLSFGQATGRHFGKILSGVTLGAGYLAMFWSDRRQCWHDSLAGAVVVRDPRP